MQDLRVDNFPMDYKDLASQVWEALKEDGLPILDQCGDAVRGPYRQMAKDFLNGKRGVPTDFRAAADGIVKVGPLPPAAVSSEDALNHPEVFPDAARIGVTDADGATSFHSADEMMGRVGLNHPSVSGDPPIEEGSLAANIVGTHTPVSPDVASDEGVVVGEHQLPQGDHMQFMPSTSFNVPSQEVSESPLDLKDHNEQVSMDEGQRIEGGQSTHSQESVDSNAKHSGVDAARTDAPRDIQEQLSNVSSSGGGALGPPPVERRPPVQPTPDKVEPKAKARKKDK